MDWRTLTHSQVLELLPDRDLYAHKGNFGKLLLLCGSRGYTGAAALAAMGALRSGAGLVYLGVPESIYAIEAMKLTEAIVFPLPEEGGMLSSASEHQIMAMLDQMDAVLIGPGLGQSRGTSRILKSVMDHAKCPVVVDADGINLLSSNMDILRGRSFPTVLTPHMGEYMRISPTPVKDRETAAVEFADLYHTILVLKGHDTLVTDGQTGYRNPTGNPGMAVGGSGDVLAGMITALIGQGMAALQAAACGAWLHGRAGDLCAEELGQFAMLPSDLLNKLPRLLK